MRARQMGLFAVVGLVAASVWRYRRQMLSGIGSVRTRAVSLFMGGNKFEAKSARHSDVPHDASHKRRSKLRRQIPATKIAPTHNRKIV